ncbi:MAG: HlyD family type I secretion periplasmic adaptor subunit, partial [Pseudomonadota bacterium]
VSADAVIDERTGVLYYRALIDIPEDAETARLFANDPLTPGMPVEAFIKTGSQPAASYILRPLTDSMARAMREE